MMLAFPGLSLSEAMGMTYRQRNVFLKVFKRVHKN